MAPTVTVDREEEEARGWAFDITVRPDSGGSSRHAVTLSWADYEHWSHGAAAPERVARAVVESLLEAGSPSPLPDRFDAATARRWLRDLDDRMRSRL